ncbi:Ubiquitin carboxyl-terminal hydrolase 25 [Lamellibrachia satsuma]|nr:Ubiquitin carboxyl-terminal hydrolase 25 [Lamellibrachia satsuma]
MYSDDQLRKYPYQLHAVLVHEGQAVSGHYWAYIKSRRHDKWLKFNDITVTDATWEELQRESIGGYHNTSAYCLMYVDNNNEQLLDDSDLGELKVALDMLPRELQKYVTEDNSKFEREMCDWDEEVQRRKDAQATKVHESSPQQLLSTTELRQSETTGTQTQALLSLSQQHALLFYRDTCNLVSKVTDSEHFHTNGVSAALSSVLASELETQQTVAQSVPKTLPKRDARLGSMVVYLLVNGVSHDSIIRRVMLEQISELTELDTEESAKKVRLCASSESQQLKQSFQNNDTQNFQEWHLAYSQYMHVAAYFVMGVSEFSKERYVEALPYLTYACDKNDALTDTGKHPLKGLDMSLVRYFRRQCLLCLNENATHLFENDDHSSLNECLDIMNKLVLPCLPALSNAPLDQSTIEDIREKWCLFLNQELGDYRIEKLQDFLSRLLETPIEIKAVYCEMSLQPPGSMDLTSRYDRVMDWAQEHSDLQATTK